MAVKLAIDITFSTYIEFNKLNFVPKNYDCNELNELAKLIAMEVTKMQNKNYNFIEPYEKYSNEKYLKVSLLVSNNINQLKRYTN